MTATPAHSPHFGWGRRSRSQPRPRSPTRLPCMWSWTVAAAPGLGHPHRPSCPPLSFPGPTPCEGVPSALTPELLGPVRLCGPGRCSEPAAACTPELHTVTAMPACGPPGWPGSWGVRSGCPCLGAECRGSLTQPCAVALTRRPRPWRRRGIPARACVVQGGSGPASSRRPPWGPFTKGAPKAQRRSDRPLPQRY